jgi:aspartate carbamoyltransferase regulatory subunit
MKKEIAIPAIKDGTVIDHVPSRMTFRVMRILNPQEFEHTINVALNLKSKKMGKKGIIKISNRTLTQDEVNKIALLAPKASVSIIKDYKVKNKIRIKLPKKVTGSVKCSNPKCITNAEAVTTHFKTLEEEPLRIQCYYCERIMGREDIKLL